MQFNAGMDFRRHIDRLEIDVIDVVFEVVELNFLDNGGDLFAINGDGVETGFLGVSDLPLFGFQRNRDGFFAAAVNDSRDESGLPETAGRIVAELAPRLSRDHILCFAHGFPFAFILENFL
jgi:hypothetical protein